MKTRATVLALLLCGTAVADSNFVRLGEIDLTGTFTLNHSYNFNDQGASPFGYFGTLTVKKVTGIFAPYVTVGDNLAMNSTALNTVSPFPVWTIGGFSLSTTFVLITGADPGRFCFGRVDLSGNGFDPNNYPPSGAYAHWEFTAPPYDISQFNEDITGPISFSIFVGYDNGHVPEARTHSDVTKSGADN